jgi:outer-membrane receptor for ferric coprogen and ferric-rhodotorulic acid
MPTKGEKSFTTRALWLAATALPLGIAAGAFATPAMAQTDTRTYEFNIPAGKLSAALNAWAAATGYQFAWAAPEAQSLDSPGLKGRMTAEAALRILTTSSGVTYSSTGERTVTITRPIEADGTRVLGAVRVEGTQGAPYFGGAGQTAGVNGINGSRDITATEGTGSFTSGALTIGSKAPQALKDVPQSISVLTSERLEQQNVTDFNKAMRQLPGVTLVQGDTGLENQFLSRGFPITSIQVDGGAPLTTTRGFFPQIDMSVYDHVELLRGASGTFTGYGDPGGTVNLVRKKPLDHPQYVLDAQAGSWSNYRVVADASSPLALDGKLRGRLVMTYQNNHYFYDLAKDNKSLIYGIVEMDVTPTTVISIGTNYTQQNSLPWYLGLPRYSSGADLKLPRSTCLCFPWNRWNFRTTEFLGMLEQKLGEDWTLKVNLTNNRQRSERKVGFSTGSVNPTNKLGPLLSGSYGDYASTQLSTETVLTGAFNVFGQRQEITAGINRVYSSSGGQKIYQNPMQPSALNPYQAYPGGPSYYPDSPNGSWPTIGNLFNFDPTNLLFNEPRNSLPMARTIVSYSNQLGAYINLRLTAFDRIHLTTGFRWSRFLSKSHTDYLCTEIPAEDPGFPGTCFGKQLGDTFFVDRSYFKDDDTSWPPPVSLSFDLTNNLTAYVGYTNIYISQARSLDVNRNPLNPVTGGNWEGGAKWSARGGKINASIAGFRTRQNGFGLFDPSLGYERVGSQTCCYRVNENATLESTGLDFDFTGELLPGWQVSASYVFNKTIQKGSSYGEGEGMPFVSIQPKNIYKLWMTYDFGAGNSGGPLSGLAISGGMNGQSSGYRSGMTCVEFTGQPDPIYGGQECAEGAFLPFSFTVPAYTVFSGRVDYKISKTWSLAINLENILDKTYYQTVSDIVENGHWYGAPRSFTASLRAKW